jgi:hypothetical protein
VFDTDAVLRTVYPARGVEEARRDPPQGDEAPEPFGQSAIARCRFVALGTLAVPGGVRFQVNIDAQGGTVSAEADLVVNKTGEMLNPVQDGLNVQLNNWSPGSGFVVFDNRKLPAPDGISYSFLDRSVRRRLPWFLRPRWPSPTGVEPPRAEAKRTLGRGPRRATGAPSGVPPNPSSPTVLPTNSATEPIFYGGSSLKCVLELRRPPSAPSSPSPA